MGRTVVEAKVSVGVGAQIGAWILRIRSPSKRVRVWGLGFKVFGWFRVQRGLNGDCSREGSCGNIGVFLHYPGPYIIGTAADLRVPSLRCLHLP